MRRGTPQNPRLAHSIPIVQNHRCSTTQWIPNKQHPVSWCLLAAPITAATLNLLRTCVSQIPALGSYVSSFLQIIDSDLRTQRNRKPMFTCNIYSYTWYLPEQLTSSFFIFSTFSRPPVSWRGKCLFVSSWFTCFSFRRQRRWVASNLMKRP